MAVNGSRRARPRAPATPAARPGPAPSTVATPTVLLDVWLLIHLTTALLDDAVGLAGLDAHEFGLYATLAATGPVTPTQLTRWTGIRPTTLSAMLRRVAQRGDLERLPHPGDGRSYLVRLTESGRTRYRDAQVPFRRVADQVAEALGSDEQQVRLGLQRLDEALRTLAELDPRPYRIPASVPGDGAGTWRLTYSGPPLTPEQEAEVGRFIAWVRSSRPAAD